MAQEADSKEVAYSKLCRLFVNNKSCNCADAQVGTPDAQVGTPTHRFYNAPDRKGALGRRGLAEILDVDDAVVAVKSKSQISKVARYRVRKKVGAQAGGEVGWGPATRGSDTLGGTPPVARGKNHGG